MDNHSPYVIIPINNKQHQTIYKTRVFKKQFMILPIYCSCPYDHSQDEWGWIVCPDFMYTPGDIQPLSKEELALMLITSKLKFSPIMSDSDE